MPYPSSGPVRLRTNLADYPVTMALKKGEIASSLVAFDFCGPKVAHDGFKGMVRENAYDAGELAIVTFLQAVAYGKPYVMLPVAISGRMQHHTIGYNAARGVLAPKDIEGRKVGVRSYAQTTGLWARGILHHEYGVDLDKVTWLTTEDGHLAEFRDPPNCQRLPKGSKLGEMLLAGELDAAILGNDMPDDPRLRTLIPDAKSEAARWHAREGFVPINHVFVVHRDLSQARPDVVREIFRLIVESRAKAPASVAASLPPVGLEANRKGIQVAIEWALEQRILPHRVAVDDLVDGTTASLTA